MNGPEPVLGQVVGAEWQRCGSWGSGSRHSGHLTQECEYLSVEALGDLRGGRIVGGLIWASSMTKLGLASRKVAVPALAGTGLGYRDWASGECANGLGQGPISFPQRLTH
jgi:hypothetical protein